MAACIERSNPFDPINGRSVEEVQKQDFPALNALLKAGSAFTKFLKTEADRFNLDSVYNASVIRQNSVVRDSNNRVRIANANVEEYNLRQTAVDSLRFMTRYGYQKTLAIYTLPDDFAANRSALLDGLRSASKHMDSVNTAHFPKIVYDGPFIKLSLEPFAIDILAFARIQASVNAANETARDSNVAVLAYNNAREEENGLVDVYNASINFRKLTKNADVIVSSDSLKASGLTAKAGDTLYLGPGTFNVDLRFSNSGTSDSPIVVLGFPGRATIIRPLAAGANSLILSTDQKYIHFESLVFRGGGQSNVKLEGGNASNISFHNCLFDSSKGAGLEVFDSDIELTDCEVRANAGHGVRVTGGISPDKSARFTNVLFARNGRAGLEGTSQQLILKKCTLANNGTDGIQLISPSQGIEITNSVFAWNSRYGINRQAVVDNQEKLSVSESILFSNGVNWGLDAMEESRKEVLIQANPIIDPEFIDTLAFNYNPRPGSFLDASEKLAVPVVVIGYRKASP